MPFDMTRYATPVGGANAQQNRAQLQQMGFKVGNSSYSGPMRQQGWYDNPGASKPPASQSAGRPSAYTALYGQTGVGPKNPAAEAAQYAAWQRDQASKASFDKYRQRAGLDVAWGTAHLSEQQRYAKDDKAYRDAVREAALQGKDLKAMRASGELVPPWVKSSARQSPPRPAGDTNTAPGFPDAPTGSGKPFDTTYGYGDQWANHGAPKSYRPGQANPTQQPSEGTQYGQAPAGWHKVTVGQGTRSQREMWVGPNGERHNAAGGWMGDRNVAPWERPPEQLPDNQFGAATHSMPSGFYGNALQAAGQYAPPSMYQTPGQTFGPGADPLQQAYQQSMNAWQMPKQQLMQWGQQQQNVPWGPNYGNNFANRPDPYSMSVQGQFGNNLTDMWGGIGGFVQGVNNQAAQQPVGTYLGQGNPGAAYGKANYNIPQLVQQGNQMFANGWQNPFM